MRRPGAPLVKVSKPEKVLFPDDGITKGDLAAYYERVARQMLRHIKDRPISMQRFPDGIAKHGFFHKEVPDHFPDWIKRVTVRKRNGTVTHAVACNADTLVYLADQACITPHVWLSRADEIEQPDRMVFDLDPSNGSFGEVRRAARSLGELLDGLGLASFAMTTGSRGLHVWVPLRRQAGFDEVRTFARDVARVMVLRAPDHLTLEARKQKRAGRLLIDIMRNGYAQTAVAPYAVRPRTGAPVATPLRWRELSDSSLRPDKYTLRNIGRRLSRVGDPWEEMARHANGLGPARRRLDKLLVDRSPASNA
jgi:bifunctional non-homologous end joining protein LigD